MPEAASVLAPWSNFYIIMGSSAAALTGLMFVVVTLVAGNPAHAKSEGISTFSTPTVVHFCVALLVAATLAAPWRSLVPASVILGLTGLYGVAYVSLIAIRARRLTVYRPQFEDWLWYTVLPLIAYVAIAVAALRLPAAPTWTLFALGAGTALLIFAGIHNAWDVVTYLAVEGVPDVPPTAAVEVNGDRHAAREAAGDDGKAVDA